MNNKGLTERMAEYVRKRNELIEKEAKEKFFVVEGNGVTIVNPDAAPIQFEVLPNNGNCYEGKGTWSGAENQDLNQEEK